MIFIDGGYLREGLKRLFGHDRIDFSSLLSIFKSLAAEERIHPEIIRVFYYDAIVDPLDDQAEHKKQQEYFSNIRKCPQYEVKLGRLIKTKDNYRQKGVDILISLDMITKAYMNHYDIAILIGGDDDFVDLVRAVKDLAGKRVYGAFYREQVSQNLSDSFDKRFPLTKDLLESWKIIK